MKPGDHFTENVSQKILWIYIIFGTLDKRVVRWITECDLTSTDKASETVANVLVHLKFGGV
jgi:hypothetical protein